MHEGAMSEQVNLKETGFHPSLSFLMDGVRNGPCQSHADIPSDCSVFGGTGLSWCFQSQGDPQAIKALWLHVLYVILRPLTDAGGVQGQKLSNFFTPFGDTQMSPALCP